MPEYKLTYFNARGRAELTRLVFAAAGVKFVDERISDWPNGKESAPLGQLPYLTVDGLKLPQSLSIARFVAKRFNLAGSDDLEQAKADAIVDTIVDFLNAYVQKVFMAKEEDKHEARVKFLKEDTPGHLAKIEKLISLYGSNGHSVGSSLIWSDLAVFDISSTVLHFDEKVLDNSPLMKAVRESVLANAHVAEYLKNRPQTDF